MMLMAMAMLSQCSLQAQAKQTEMADLMRGSGKIYVVIAVLLTILAGLIVYLVSLDRRIRRMEGESE